MTYISGPGPRRSDLVWAQGNQFYLKPVSDSLAKQTCFILYITFDQIYIYGSFDINLI